MTYEGWKYTQREHHVPYEVPFSAMFVGSTEQLATCIGPLMPAPPYTNLMKSETNIRITAVPPEQAN